MSKPNDYNMKQNKVDAWKVKSAYFRLKLSAFTNRRGNEIIKIPILSLNKVLLPQQLRFSRGTRNLFFKMMLYRTILTHHSVEFSLKLFSAQCVRNKRWQKTIHGAIFEQQKQRKGFWEGVARKIDNWYVIRNSLSRVRDAIFWSWLKLVTRISTLDSSNF